MTTRSALIAAVSAVAVAAVLAGCSAGGGDQSASAAVGPSQNAAAALLSTKTVGSFSAVSSEVVFDSRADLDLVDEAKQTTTTDEFLATVESGASRLPETLLSGVQFKGGRSPAYESAHFYGPTAEQGEDVVSRVGAVLAWSIPDAVGGDGVEAAAFQTNAAAFFETEKPAGTVASAKGVTVALLDHELIMATGDPDFTAAFESKPDEAAAPK